MLFIMASLLSIALCSAPAFAVQDATSEWNSACATYSFHRTDGAITYTTFSSAYYGSDFNKDFAAVLAAVAVPMGTLPPDFIGSDLLGASLQSWPDP